MSDDIRDIQHRVGQLEQCVATGEAQHGEVMRCLRRIEHALDGNGRDGLVVRVDRAEQTLRRVSWLIGIVIASTISALTAGIMGWL
jgi:hypothetical protein